MKKDILVHVYGYGKKNPDRPDFRARFSISAAKILQRCGETNHFFVSGGQIFGDALPPIGKVTGDELQRKLHLCDNEITIATTMRESGGEVPIKSSSREISAFLQHAGSSQITSLASWVHTFSINHHYRYQGVANPNVLSAEQILLSIPSSDKTRAGYKRWRGIILKMYFSKEQLLLTAQEIVKNLILLHPNGEDWLRAKADKMAAKPRYD